MFRSENRVIIVGTLGHKPELRRSPEGVAVSVLAVSTQEIEKDDGGDPKENTVWHRVVLSGRQAEFAAQCFTKGCRIHVEGRLQSRTWEDAIGISRFTTEVIGDTLSLLDGSPDDEAPPSDAGSHSVPNIDLLRAEED